jgi:two-component system LytT family sensor kinase
MLSPIHHLIQRVPLFWRLQFMIWSAYFVYGCILRTSHYNHLAMGVGMSLLLEPTSFLISSGLRVIYRRLDFQAGLSLRTCGYIVLFSFAATIVQIIITQFASPWVAAWADYRASPAPLLTKLAFFAIIYLSWSVAYVWLKSEFAAREIRAAAQRAELQMLRLQLNPHFMFNSLNNIASQIPDQPETALEMTHNLADFLRYSLDQEGRMIAPLAHEVEVLTTYLKIEKLRFEDRLHYEIQVDANTLGMKLPSFLLQPLVENAVKHGLNSSAPPWVLKVLARREGEQLILQICNSGQLRADWQDRPDQGIGLGNLERRLTMHYPGRHRFKLRQEGSMVCAEIQLTGAPAEI